MPATIDDMKKKNITPNTAEKLYRLFERHPEISKAEAGRAAGVTYQSILAYVKGATPRADAIARLAPLFKVDALWLATESEPWIDPPPPGAWLSDQAFTAELNRRYAERARSLLDLYERAEAIDWNHAWEVASKLEPGDEIPEELRESAEVAAKLGEFPHVKLVDFDVGRSGDADKAIKAAGIDKQQLTYGDLLSRTVRLRKKQYGTVASHLRSVRLVSAVERMRQACESTAGSSEELLAHLSKLLDEDGG